MVKRVGKYEMGRTLGEGTFGKVKHAINTETNEAVAIKVLDKEKIQKQNMGNQIKKEISIMKMVNHKYIVQMIEVLASKTKIFIVLELVTGGELFDKIVSVGKLNEDQAIFYFNQLVEGVEYCHKLGVCHRDLKPENLLLDQHGNLKISDFGLSSLYVGDAEADGASRTELLHTTCGTPNYVAPEVLADNGYDGKRADVWSCGVILYVLLAGFLPFDESTITQLFSKIKNADFTYPPWFSAEARSTLDQMLVADPKARITLTQLREIPWLLDRAITEAPLAAVMVPTEAQLEAAVQAVSPADEVAALEREMDDDDDDWDDLTNSKAGGGVGAIRTLNAFDLINQCGGFRLDKMFSPQIFAAPQLGAEPVLDGILRFGAAGSVRLGRFNFTSPVVPTETLVHYVYEALVESGCEVGVSLESVLLSGNIRATKMTPKGMVGIGIQIFSLCSSLSLLVIKRGKGDFLGWNKLYEDLIENRIGRYLNRVTAEGEAKDSAR